MPVNAAKAAEIGVLRSLTLVLPHGNQHNVNAAGKISLVILSPRRASRMSRKMEGDLETYPIYPLMIDLHTGSGRFSYAHLRVARYSATRCLEDLHTGEGDILYLPTKCEASFSFSLQTYSNKSVSSLMCWRSLTVQGAV